LTQQQEIYHAIQGQVSLLKGMGYDCYMVFVNTNLEVALERNKKDQ
jgi:hypothetical protein